MDPQAVGEGAKERGIGCAVVVAGANQRLAGAQKVAASYAILRKVDTY